MGKVNDACMHESRLRREIWSSKVALELALSVNKGIFGRR